MFIFEPDGVLFKDPENIPEKAGLSYQQEQVYKASYVYEAHPGFSNFDVADEDTRSVAEVWHDRQRCGGPLFTRSLDCDHQKGIAVPTI